MTPKRSVAFAEYRTDADLAHSIVEALRSQSDVPPSVEATLRDGVVTLTGSVAWPYQLKAAERAINSLAGVRGLKSVIAVNPNVPVEEVYHRVLESLHRRHVDACKVRVDVEGRTVTLTGSVDSWVQKNEAERAAWRASGVAEVRNRLEIGR